LHSTPLGSASINSSMSLQHFGDLVTDPGERVQ
jgi:hypothetical protein